MKTNGVSANMSNMFVRVSRGYVMVPDYIAFEYPDTKPMKLYCEVWYASATSMYQIRLFHVPDTQAWVDASFDRHLKTIHNNGGWQNDDMPYIWIYFSAEEFGEEQYEMSVGQMVSNIIGRWRPSTPVERRVAYMVACKCISEDQYKDYVGYDINDAPEDVKHELDYGWYWYLAVSNLRDHDRSPEVLKTVLKAYENAPGRYHKLSAVEFIKHCWFQPV